MSRYRSGVIISLLLVLMNLAVYQQVRNYEFTNYDDDEYVSQNPYVRAGLTKKSVVWAFTSKVHGHWHPVTWLSHMADVELFGVDPGWHHLSSVFFHILNTLLLFFVLQRMTGGLLRSAFVAALFAIHPLHVEPVAWVADRKDLLSTFFWLSAMWAYYRYGEEPRLSTYFLVIALFVVGFMAKSMVITLPFIFLLMDYWPLGRFRLPQFQWKGGSRNNRPIASGDQTASLLRLVAEKVPFVVVTGAFVILMTFVRQEHFVEKAAQKVGHAVAPVTAGWVSAPPQLARVPVSYVAYIGKMLWPFDLATPYPYSYPGPGVIWEAGTTGLLLASISFLVLWTARRYPYLVVGWLWYVVTLLPVIGLLKYGPHVPNDRYTYVPLIGIFIMIAWGVPDLVRGWRYRRLLLAVSTGIVLLGLSVCTWFQVGYWKNSHTLFGRAVDVTSNNWLAHNNLAVALEEEGRLDEAITQYSKALGSRASNVPILNNLAIVYIKQGKAEEAIGLLSRAIEVKPEFVYAYTNMGNALLLQGKVEEAADYYLRALEIAPTDVHALKNLGMARAMQGRQKEAIGHLSEVIRLRPNFAEGHFQLGVTLAAQGRIQEAVDRLYEALRIRPGYFEAHNNLGVILAAQGRLHGAIKHYTEAIRVKPDSAEVHHNLAIALANNGQLEEATHHYLEAVRLRPDYAEAHNKLGVVLARQGRLQDAIRHFSEALRIEPAYAEAHNNLGVALANQGRLDEAIRHYSEALLIKPDYAEAHDNLGAVLASQGKVDEATHHFSEALRIKRNAGKGEQE